MHLDCACATAALMLLLLLSQGNLTETGPVVMPLLPSATTISVNGTPTSIAGGLHVILYSTLLCSALLCYTILYYTILYSTILNGIEYGILIAACKYTLWFCGGMVGLRLC